LGLAWGKEKRDLNAEAAEGAEKSLNAKVAKCAKGQEIRMRNEKPD
jgi:hypothetical protein